MSGAQNTDRRDVEDRLTARAAADPEFRRQLVDDPRGAVGDELGVSLPADVTITVLQETPDQVYLVIPASIEDSPSGELTDAELAAVAGGSVWDDIFTPGTGNTTCSRAVDATCGLGPV